MMENQAEIIEELEQEVEQVEEMEDEEAAPVEGDDESDEVAEPDGELTITIGDEESPSSDETHAAPEWVREVRQRNRELSKRVRELESQQPNDGRQTSALGKKPELSKFDYDEEAYATAFEKWHTEKRRIEEAEAAGRREQEQIAAEWQQTVQAYESRKKSLKVPDFQDAEDAVADSLSVAQQGVILHATKSPELVVFALGKNPTKLKEFANIKDPVKLAYALGALEKEIKVKPRNSTRPQPETVVTSSGGTRSNDARLAQLRAEAEKTGDYTKVTAYRRQMRKK